MQLRRPARRSSSRPAVRLGLDRLDVERRHRTRRSRPVATLPSTAVEWPRRARSWRMIAGTITSPPTRLTASPTAITGDRCDRAAARAGRAARGSRSSATRGAVPTKHVNANSDTGFGWNRCVAITITGQCHRYVPYDTRPRYTAARCRQHALHQPAVDTSSATMSAHVAIVAATPRWIAPRWIVDVATSTSAASVDRRERLHDHRRRRPRRRASTRGRDREQRAGEQFVRAGVGAVVRAVEVRRSTGAARRRATRRTRPR